MKKFLLGIICVGAGYFIGSLHTVSMCGRVLYRAAEGDDKAKELILDLDHLGKMQIDK